MESAIANGTAMRRFRISGLLTYRAIDTLKEKGAAGMLPRRGILLTCPTY